MALPPDDPAPPATTPRWTDENLSHPQDARAGDHARSLARCGARRKNTFVAPLPSGDIGVFRRMRSGLRLLYVLTERVDVEPRWPFFDMAWETIVREWPHQQIKAMLFALKGRKR